MMLGPMTDGRARSLVLGVLIGCGVGVALVVAAVAYSAYRIATCLWGGQ